MSGGGGTPIRPAGAYVYLSDDTKEVVYGLMHFFALFWGDLQKGPVHLGHIARALKCAGLGQARLPTEEEIKEAAAKGIVAPEGAEAVVMTLTDRGRAAVRAFELGSSGLLQRAEDAPITDRRRAAH